MTVTTSRLPGFYQLDRSARITRLAAVAGLSREQRDLLTDGGGLGADEAEHMLGNVVGVYGLPLGIATNFTVNGQDVLVPMVVEEPSIVAAASLGARLAREGGGFVTESEPPVMIAQLQVLDVPDLAAARGAVETAQAELIALADARIPGIVARGGGARRVETRVLEHPRTGPMLIVHVLIDVRDAMGANALNTVAEARGPRVAELTRGRVNLKILSNLASHRLVRATCTVPATALHHDLQRGRRIVERIVEAQAFADVDPYRAATHNKGVMNGISAVAVATGNDWRGIEAAVHAFAALGGAYRPVTCWEVDGNGDLAGRIEAPLTFGLVGGTTSAHPLARLNLAILGQATANGLNEVVAAVGLAQNLAALRALVTEGIQAGHMALHAKQIALAAGARGQDVVDLAARMVGEDNIREVRARDLLEQAAPDADRPTGGVTVAPYNTAFFAVHETTFRVLSERHSAGHALSVMAQVFAESLGAAFDQAGFTQGRTEDFARVIAERDAGVGLVVRFPQMSEDRIAYRFHTDPFPGLRGLVAAEELDATYMRFKVAHLLGAGWAYRTTRHLWNGDPYTEHVIERT